MDPRRGRSLKAVGAMLAGDPAAVGAQPVPAPTRRDRARLAWRALQPAL